LAATAKVTKWLVISAERFATQRLDALVHAEDRSDEKVPSVLFLCVHNAGRSQMALGWFTHLAGDRAVAWLVVAARTSHAALRGRLFVPRAPGANAPSALKERREIAATLTAV
jgi:hypothetical protein